MSEIPFSIGSKSSVKQRALVAALHSLELRFTVNAVEARSGVNCQAVGLAEIVLGASNRASAARELFPHSFAVGIESGIIRRHATTTDVAYVVVITPDHKTVIGHSTGITFPEQYVVEAERQGFCNTTVGRVIAAKLGGSHSDPHAILTEGRLARQRVLEQAIYATLATIKFPKPLRE